MARSGARLAELPEHLRRRSTGLTSYGGSSSSQASTGVGWVIVVILFGALLLCATAAGLYYGLRHLYNWIR